MFPLLLLDLLLWMENGENGNIGMIVLTHMTNNTRSLAPTLVCPFVCHPKIRTDWRGVLLFTKPLAIPLLILTSIIANWKYSFPLAAYHSIIRLGCNHPQLSFNWNEWKCWMVIHPSTEKEASKQVASSWNYYLDFLLLTTILER